MKVKDRTTKNVLNIELIDGKTHKDCALDLLNASALDYDEEDGAFIVDSVENMFRRLSYQKNFWKKEENAEKFPEYFTGEYFPDDFCIDIDTAAIFKWENLETPELCLEAVKDNGFALEYVKEQTPELCLAAVRENGNALQYVREQTPEICLAAVKQTGFALEYVKEQTREICAEAIWQVPEAADFVKIDLAKQHSFTPDRKPSLSEQIATAETKKTASACEGMERGDRENERE